jgi:hypothetical protein
MNQPVYKPGDLIGLTHDFANQPRLGPFEVLRIMPQRDNAEAQYRVRGPDGRERAIEQHEIVESSDASAAPSQITPGGSSG